MLSPSLIHQTPPERWGEGGKEGGREGGRERGRERKGGGGRDEEWEGG